MALVGVTNSMSAVEKLRRKKYSTGKAAAAILSVFSLISSAVVSWSCRPAQAADNPQKVYKKALPGYVYHFPQDHYSHDEFKTEWWYYTGHLKAKDGRRFGFELTFFRNGANYQSGQKGKLALDNFYLAHFAVTDEQDKKFVFYEKLNRKGVKFADARQDIYHVYNEGWSVTQLGDKFVLKADGKDYAVNLILNAVKPPVVHGKDGVSQKASCAGCASHYYSMPRLTCQGLIFVKDKPLEVTGQAWMDHEFGSNQLTGDQVGWDWYSIQLSGNRELMLYVMRREDGTFEKQSSGTYIDASGKVTHLNLADFKIEKTGTWTSPKTKGVYPMGWKVTVPSQKISLQLKPIMQDQELLTKRSTGVSYWEGAVDIFEGNGSTANVPVGEGYVELTGYSEKFTKSL